MIEPINVKEEAYEYGIGKQLLPESIIANLRHTMFDWQETALELLLVKWAVHKKQMESDSRRPPLHLLFNMATGSGKTLVMAAAMLHFYREGYKHFLFFVNRNNIVDKTENNFCSPAHGKYLFADNIRLDDMHVPVRKVENFSDRPAGIEIKFVSMQKLHNDIHAQRENRTTLDDLNRRNIVMLADEAHHLNADTSGQTALALDSELSGQAGAADVERRGWEHTVIKLILHKNDEKENNRNVLLEFTATIPEGKSPAAREAIAKKYEGKLLYQFELKEFLRRGYTKEINLLSSTLNKKQRVLLALLLQWHRCQIAAKHGIQNFKPVLLFRSRTIAESRDDYAEFLRWMDADTGIGEADFAFMEQVESSIERDAMEGDAPHDMGASRLRQMLAHIGAGKIGYADIALWMKANYSPRHTIITNSQDEASKNGKKEKGGDAATEALLNNLEHPSNRIRAIFTVNRLTEGWDVLNLFDIVRLYQGSNAAAGKETPKATVEEKQLIGRGVRYWPFAHGDAIPHKRKFDDNLSHELRALEELFFHTYDERSAYIRHLKAALREDGYLPENRAVQEFALKPEFAESEFYNRAKIWVNKPKANPNRRRKTLADIELPVVEYRLPVFALTEEAVDLQDGEDRCRARLGAEAAETIEVSVRDIEKPVFDFALNMRAAQTGRLCSFAEMREVMDIACMDDLQDKLAAVKIRFVAARGTSYADISSGDKLQATLRALDMVTGELKKHDAPRIGGEFFREPLRAHFAAPKTKTIDPRKLDPDIARHKWYVLNAFAGSSEEKALVRYVADVFGNLDEKYSEIYLLRNEEVYKIHDFARARGFCPDFILFLRGRGKERALFGDEERQARTCYQVLIEPKGAQFAGADGAFASGREGWKADFLDDIRRRYGGAAVFDENQGYRLIGLPLFNESDGVAEQSEFFRLFEKLLVDGAPRGQEE